MPSKLRRPFSGRPKLLALAMFALALLVVRLIWGAWTKHRLDEAMSALRARGEAVEAADVTYPDVPDEENAWTLQFQAINSQTLAAESPRNSNMMYVGNPPYRERWWKMAEASEGAHANAFALMRQARQSSRVKLRDRLTTPLFNNFVLPRINGAKSLVNSLADGAELVHLKGDDAESVERIFDILHLTRSLRQDGFLVSQLVCIGIDALTCSAIQMIAPGLKIGRDAPAATPQQVRRLIEVLLDEREPREGMLGAVVMERLMWTESCRTRAAGTWFTRPLADDAVLHAVRNFDLYRRAVQCDDMPDAQVLLGQVHRQVSGTGMLPSDSPQPRELPRYSRWYVGFDPVFSPSIERHFRMIAERRVTATALACHLFCAEHGRFPERLEELVPRYVPRVPADPFAGDGREVGYVTIKGGLPGGGDRPMLYYDENGVELGPPAEPQYSWHVDPNRKSGRIRQYRDLTRWNPPDQSAQETIDDQPEEPDAPGEEEEINEDAEEPEADQVRDVDDDALEPLSPRPD